MLVSAAADAWGLPASEITVTDGVISHPSGKRGAFGEFAAAAAELPVPENVTLTAPSEWTHIGDESDRRHDTAVKTDGTPVLTGTANGSSSCAATALATADFRAR